MKLYFSLIQASQQILLVVSIAILAILPSLLSLYPELVSTSLLFSLAHVSLFFVMLIRPLSDLLPQFPFIRPLVILRKGIGVFSSAIIVSFIISKIMTIGGEYFSTYLTAAYWSINSLAFFAHSADVAAVLLLVTSNNLSKKILGKNWKRVQKLSYVYFYGSGIYVVGLFGDKTVLSYLVIVTTVTLLAYFSNKQRTLNKS